VQMIEIYNEQVRDLLVTDGLNKKYPWSNYVFWLIVWVWLCFIMLPQEINFP
jgi:hypothetical protein